jgi:hypothetical protein
MKGFLVLTAALASSVVAVPFGPVRARAMARRVVAHCSGS